MRPNEPPLGVSACSTRPPPASARSRTPPACASTCPPTPPAGQAAGPRPRPAVRAGTLDPGPYGKGSQFAGEYPVALNADVRPILETIRVPTLVLHRIGNRYIRVGNGRYLADHIARAKFVELPGDDHFFYAGDVEAMLAPIEEFLTGARPAVDDERVLATVLFTDIVGSTEHATQLGDRAWRDLLEGHDTAVRLELGRFRGREIHTTGDGFFATFDGPARAVRCALAIREAVRPLGLEIRAGLPTGEGELRGDDVRGIAVRLRAPRAPAAK